MNVLIVGCGNIGSRHLQSLASETLSLNIWVVDPSSDSLQKAETIWENSKNPDSKVKVHFCNDISTVPSEILLCIIATNSDVRLLALQSVLSHTDPRVLILEKFLFPKSEEYTAAQKFLRGRKDVYVNCPRRIYDAYAALKQSISQNNPITMHVSGNSWGMASNSIHFIDLFMHVSHSKQIRSCAFTNTSNTKVIPAKREGFIEIFGEVKITTDNGSELTVICNEGAFEEIDMRIVQNNNSILIKEKGGKILVHNHEKESSYGIPFQSQLTSKYLEDFLSKGKLELTSFELSAEYHLSFLNAIQELLSSIQYSGSWQIS